MRLIFCFSLSALVICGACHSQTKRQTPGTTQVVKPLNPLAWIDTVRFNTELTDEQQKLVYLTRNNEEDYELLKDTNRVALRFFWWRAFHPYVVVRLENRPELHYSGGKLKVYEEWFALYKENVQRLNHDCPMQIDDKCYGKPYPFVHQQNINILKVNEVPQVVAKLADSGFWDMKSEYMSGLHTDGSSWTLEVYSKGKYKQVTTDLEQHPIKSICLEMLRLTGKKVEPKYIY
jgi:hypothetical protein